MSHKILGIVLAVLVSATAHAQVPPPHAYQPSAEERELLEHGEISDGQKTGGGVTALLVGFGMGQAIQGRWLERGWIFTVGDIAATAAMVAGPIVAFSYDCNAACMHRGEALILGGSLLSLGLRIWQTTDAFVIPARHNARVRELRRRLDLTANGIALRF
jgi:hypothetical protein